MEGTCSCCGLPLATGDVYCGSCGQPVPAAGMAAAPVSADWPGYQSMSAAGDLAEWPRTPSAEYLGHRLVYNSEPEAPFDPLASFRLLVQFARHAARYAMIFLAWGAVAAGSLLLGQHVDLLLSDGPRATSA